MSCAIVSIIYGIPLTKRISNKIQEWKDSNDERWADGDRVSDLCGFQTLYSASGDSHVGFCGVELDQLASYRDELVSERKFTPTAEQKVSAEAMVAALDTELRELAGPIGTYFIWSDS